METTKLADFIKETEIISLIKSRDFNVDPFLPGYIYFTPYCSTLRNKHKIFKCSSKNEFYYCMDECKQKNDGKSECPGVIKYSTIDNTFSISTNGKELNTLLTSKLRPVLILSKVNPRCRKSGKIDPLNVIVAPIKSIKDKFTSRQSFIDILTLKGLDVKKLSQQQIEDVMFDFPYYWKIPPEIGLKEACFLDLTDIDQISTDTIIKKDGSYLPAGILSDDELEEVKWKIIDLLSVDFKQELTSS